VVLHDELLYFPWDVITGFVFLGHLRIWFLIETLQSNAFESVYFAIFFMLMATGNIRLF
jgi:hypothetical protein